MDKLTILRMVKNLQKRFTFVSPIAVLIQNRFFLQPKPIIAIDTYLLTLTQEEYTMVSEGKARLFRRKDGKYLIYVPLDLAEDSMFPFKTNSSLELKISFKIGDNKIIIEKWEEPSEE